MIRFGRLIGRRLRRGDPSYEDYEVPREDDCGRCPPVDDEEELLREHAGRRENERDIPSLETSISAF